MPSEATGAQVAGNAVHCMEIVFPHHCNHLGTLFGGQALAWMDKAAFLAATRHTGHTVVTARSERVDFRHSVALGAIVELVAEVVATGHSSLRVRVRLSSRAAPGAPAVLATTGEFVMVAVDGEGRAVPVQADRPAAPMHG